jgi:hypothetical protein
MLKPLLGGLAGRLAAYAVLGLGFWLLFRGFLLPSIVQGVAGGGLVLGGMYLMVRARRKPLAPPPFRVAGDEEDSPGDSIHRSGQSS